MRTNQRARQALAIAPKAIKSDCVVTTKKQTPVYVTKRDTPSSCNHCLDSHAHTGRAVNVQACTASIRQQRLHTGLTEHCSAAQQVVPLFSRKMRLQPKQAQRTNCANAENRINLLDGKVQTASQQLALFSQNLLRVNVRIDTKPASTGTEQTHAGPA